MIYLPDEILCLVCTQLWHQRDFSTLFNCACSGKRLATIAVVHLYRMQGVAVKSISSEKSDEEIAHAMKSAGLWRTIILSSLEKTLYPYSRYIRTLDLRGLESLLRDHRAKPCIDFFQGELAQFKPHCQLDADETANGTEELIQMKTCQLEADEAVNSIGEAITKQTPLLEELSGEVLSGVLSRWIPRLSRLKHLDTSHEATTKDNGTLIQLHCPSFKGLHLQACNKDRISSNPSDQNSAAFLNELRPQSIETFELFTCHNLGPHIFQALNYHGESLTEVTLGLSWTNIILNNLALLKGCPNLVTLSLCGSRARSIDMQELSHDSFCKIFTWLKQCKKLRSFALCRLFEPAWIAPILLVSSIHLTSLDYYYPGMQNTQQFHQALANQTSLQSLRLRGIGDSDAVDADVLVESLSKLVNLTDLCLEEISESLVDRHIMQLAGSLTKLEAWSTHGCRLTDAIWSEIASLRSLRSLQLTTRDLRSFTADGILDFVEKLGPSNKGLALSMTNHNHLEVRIEPNDDDRRKEVEKLFSIFSREKCRLIHEVIGKKVEGSFELLGLTTYGPRGY